MVELSDTGDAGICRIGVPSLACGVDFLLHTGNLAFNLRHAPGRVEPLLIAAKLSECELVVDKLIDAVAFGCNLSLDFPLGLKSPLGDLAVELVSPLGLVFGRLDAGLACGSAPRGNVSLGGSGFAQESHPLLQGFNLFCIAALPSGSKLPLDAVVFFFQQQQIVGSLGPSLVAAELFLHADRLLI